MAKGIKDNWSDIHEWQKTHLHNRELKFTTELDKELNRDL